MKPTLNQLLLGLAMLSFILTGCQEKFVVEFEKSQNSITIFQDSTVVEIEIVDESIIHVTKKKTGDNSKALPNYVTVLEAQDVEWKLKESIGFRVFYVNITD